MATTIEAERVTDNQDTTDGQGGQRIVGYWLDLAEAASAMGVSDRTVRRRIKGGQVPTRMHRGRRQVRIDTTGQADMTDRHLVDNADTHASGQIPSVRDDKVAGSVADTLATVERVDRQMAGVLATLSDDLRAERQLAVERVEVELRRVRRRSGLGWALAFVLVAAGGVGAVLANNAWTNAQIESAALRANLSASQAQVTTLAEQVESAQAVGDKAVSDMTDMARQAIQSERARAETEKQLDAMIGRAPGILKP